MSRLANVYQIDAEIVIPKGTMVAVRQRTGLGGEPPTWTIEAAIIRHGEAMFAPPEGMREALFEAAGIAS